MNADEIITKINELQSRIEAIVSLREPIRIRLVNVLNNNYGNCENVVTKRGQRAKEVAREAEIQALKDWDHFNKKFLYPLEMKIKELTSQLAELGYEIEYEETYEEAV